MEQIRKNAENTTPQNLKDLAAEFESLESQPIEKATEWTVVNLRHIVGCGCGGNTEDIHIAVPGNHPDLEDKILDRFDGTRLDDDDVETLRGMYPDASVMSGYSDYEGVTDSYDPDAYIEL